MTAADIAVALGHAKREGRDWRGGCPEARIPRTTALCNELRRLGGKSDRVGAIRRTTARIIT